MGEIADLIMDGVDEYEYYLSECWKTSARWARGKHKMKDGKIIAIKNMETSHIQNCIKFFEKNEDLDVTPFRKELKKRGLITTQDKTTEDG